MNMFPKIAGPKWGIARKLKLKVNGSAKAAKKVMPVADAICSHAPAQQQEDCLLSAISARVQENVSSFKEGR